MRRVPASVLIAVLVLADGSAPAQSWAEASVRVIGERGNVQSHGSGVIVGANGRTGLVLTARHVLRGNDRFRVYRPDGHGYRALPLVVACDADLAALLIHDTGDLPRVRLADREGGAALLAGFGSGTRLRVLRGRYTGTEGGNSLYTFRPALGDSGGGVFDPDGGLLGVNWARDEVRGVVVSLETVSRFLADPAIVRYLDQALDPPPLVSLQSPE